MKQLTLITILLLISYQVFADYIVDVAFNGNTNDIYSVEIKNGKGKREFDILLRITGDNKINNEENDLLGLGEQIIIENFKVENTKVSLSIKATSNSLTGLKQIEVNNKKRKFPILAVKQIRSHSLTLDINSWLVLSNDNNSSNSIMIRARKKLSTKKFTLSPEGTPSGKR